MTYAVRSRLVFIYSDEGQAEGGRAVTTSR